jgi:Na+ channel auxiliary subunit TipE
LFCQRVGDEENTKLAATQVRVLYSRRPWKNGTTVDMIPPSEWIDLSRYDELENKTMKDTPLLVNIKGCGYPPEITCPMFADKYENLTERGETFPCYYSRVNPWIVLEHYDFTESIVSIVAAISIPNGLFAIALIVLLFWYCPYCQARCQSHKTFFPSSLSPWKVKLVVALATFSA